MFNSNWSVIKGWLFFLIIILYPVTDDFVTKLLCLKQKPIKKKNTLQTVIKTVIIFIKSFKGHLSALQCLSNMTSQSLRHTQSLQNCIILSTQKTGQNLFQIVQAVFFKTYYHLTYNWHLPYDLQLQIFRALLHYLILNDLELES